MADTRQQFIQTTADLLEEQGYHATGLNQIVEESGAPKGSLYYYFPDGKEQISAEAVRATGGDVEDNIRATLESAEHTAEGVRTLVGRIADEIEDSQFRAGGPITTVALESAPDHDQLNAACQDVYRNWRDAFRKSLVDDGFEDERARHLAGTILSGIEGSMVVARTFQSRQPLERVADSLAELVALDE